MVDEETKQKIFAHADEYIDSANKNFAAAEGWIPESLKECHKEMGKSDIHGFQAMEWLMYDLGILNEYRKGREKNVDKNKIRPCK